MHACVFCGFADSDLHIRPLQFAFQNCGRVGGLDRGLADALAGTRVRLHLVLPA